MSFRAGPSRNSASPGRLRRTTFNGPSPLSISSPEHSRRMKFPSTTSPKVGVKSELKSPPIGGSYSNPYPGAAGVRLLLVQLFVPYVDLS